MNETIRLMKSHFSVRRFEGRTTKEVDLKEILSAGQMASSWKNFQSYSVIVVKSKWKERSFYDCFLKRFANQMSFPFVGDLNRAEKLQSNFMSRIYPEGVGNLLITSVDGPKRLIKYAIGSWKSRR